VEVVEPVKWHDQVVSSSLIRQKVVGGEIAAANALLARPYFIEGVVEKGDQRGRQLGFPTANLSVVNEVRPRAGVYVTRTEVDGRFFRSISNLGVRPTFKDDGEDLCFLETHIFDFNDQLYHRRIRVELLEFLRNEQKFAGVEELRKQIESDCRRAHEVHDELAGDWRRL
jgi:riboflavin kinase/FMN adenylyltransferase